MTQYTIAYNARCESGWSDRRGTLYGGRFTQEDVEEAFAEWKSLKEQN